MASYRGQNTRKELLKDEAFRRAYEAAKARIKKMDARWVSEPDPLKQCLLEVYVAVVEVTHSPEEGGERFPGFGKSGLAHMIAAQPREPIHRERIVACETQAAFCSGYKEGPGMVDIRETGEVHVAPVHQIECAGLEHRLVEPRHIVLARVGDTDAGRNRAPNIDLGMHLDPSLGRSEIGPRKQRQRQIDCRGVERIDNIVQLYARVFSGIQRSRPGNEMLGQPGVEAAPLLALEFGERVGAARVQRGVLGERQRAVRPINARRRREHEMPDACPPVIVQQAHGAIDVGAAVAVGLMDRLAHPGQRGKVDHGVEAAARERIAADVAEVEGGTVEWG